MYLPVIVSQAGFHQCFGEAGLPLRSARPAYVVVRNWLAFPISQPFLL